MQPFPRAVRPAARFLSTRAPPAPRTRRLGYFAAGTAVIGGTALLASDDAREKARHTALAAQRVSVVAVATARCFRLYYKTLNAEFATSYDRTEELNRTHKKAANITLRALEANGGIYIKLGQHITALTYLLPPEWTETMVPLQDRCPRSSHEEISAMFENDVGVPLSEYFLEFLEEPVGVASLAQVHTATLKSGERVAVKFQHPSLAEFVPLDIYVTQMVFLLMLKVFPEYPLTWLGDEMQSLIYVELDFRNEAQNARNTAQYFDQFKRVAALRVPGIVEAHKRVLVMEYVAGARLDDLQYMQKHRIDTAQVSSCLSHIFNNMIFTPGVGLHCDPHGGNLAIRAVAPRNGHNFEIVLYDHGLYRQIPLQMKRDYSHFWLLVLDGDVAKMRKYTARIADIQDDQQFRIFASAITGRDPEVALNYDISRARTSEEMANMQNLLRAGDGVLEDLMYILSSMPRVVLLILKTNDLTRNLDEKLNNPLGPERTFLILASYCARAVYEEERENMDVRYKRYSWNWALGSLRNWVSYQRRVGSLFFYDLVMAVRNLGHGWGFR